MLRTTAGTGCASHRARPAPPESAGLGRVVASAPALPPHLAPPHLLLGLDPLQPLHDLQLALAPDHLQPFQNHLPHLWVRDLDQLLLLAVVLLDGLSPQGTGLRMGSLGSILPDKKLVRIFMSPSIEDPYVPLATKFGADARGLVVDERDVSLRYLIAVQSDPAVRVHQR